VRLDHLLSREIRVEVIGVISALKAPMVDRAIATSLSPGGMSGCDLRVALEIGRDLAKTPNRSIVTIRVSCHSSTVKGAAAGARPRVDSRVGTAPGGRLAQLVRALP
jgi:hypothetical protein